MDTGGDFVLAGGAAMLHICGQNDRVNGQVEEAVVVDGLHFFAHFEQTDCRGLSLIANQDRIGACRSGNWLGAADGCSAAHRDSGHPCAGWVGPAQGKGERRTLRRDTVGRLPADAAQPRATLPAILDDAPSRCGAFGIDLAFIDARRQRQRPGIQRPALHELVGGICPGQFIIAFLYQFDAVDIVERWIILGVKRCLRHIERFAGRTVARVGVDPAVLRLFAKLEVAGLVGSERGFAFETGNLAKADCRVIFILDAECPAKETRFAIVVGAVAVLVVVLHGVHGGRIGRQYVDTRCVAREVVLAIELSGCRRLVIKIGLDIVCRADIRIIGAGLHFADLPVAVRRQRIDDDDVAQADVARVADGDLKLGIIADGDLLEIRRLLDSDGRPRLDETRKDTGVVAHQFARNEVIDNVRVVFTRSGLTGHETQDVEGVGDAVDDNRLGWCVVDEVYLIVTQVLVRGTVRAESGIGRFVQAHGVGHEHVNAVVRCIDMDGQIDELHGNQRRDDVLIVVSELAQKEWFGRLEGDTVDAVEAKPAAEDHIAAIGGRDRLTVADDVLIGRIAR